MAAVGFVYRCSTFLFLNRLKTVPVSVLPLRITQDRQYAKRIKGTNTPRKKPLKSELSKKGKFSGPKEVDKAVVKRFLVRKDFDSPDPVDNVWITGKHKRPLFNIYEAVKMHRETHHPTMYNEPDGKLYATLDLDMRLPGTKNKNLEAFRGTLRYPNYFSLGQEKRIVAICTDEKLQKEALQAGAVMSGGMDIIKMIKENELKNEDFDHLVVHPDMLMEIINIRGLLRHHFPTKQRGNLGIDIAELVQKFFHGVEYKSEKDPFQQDYAQVDVEFGTLSMSEKALEENLSAVLKEINQRKPPEAEHSFVLSVNIWSPPSPEKLFVDFWQYLTGYDQETMLRKYSTVNFQKLVS